VEVEHEVRDTVIVVVGVWLVDGEALVLGLKVEEEDNLGVGDEGGDNDAAVEAVKSTDVETDNVGLEEAEGHMEADNEGTIVPLVLGLIVKERDTVGDLEIVPGFDVAKGERVDEMLGETLLLRVTDWVWLGDVEGLVMLLGVLEPVAQRDTLRVTQAELEADGHREEVREALKH
jgi:hypothetical protein